MRPSILGIVVVALIATGGYTVLAGNRCGSHSASDVSASSTCGAHDASAGSCSSAGASAASHSSKIAGRFDAKMSGICRFSCATKLKYGAKDVAAQPGAKPGQLTRCPVSGVVFAVDAARPRVRIASQDYVTC
jgi:hypothetical protein